MAGSGGAVPAGGMASFDLWRFLQEANQTDESGSFAGGEAAEGMSDVGKAAREAAAAAAAAAAIVGDVAGALGTALGPTTMVVLDVWPHMCTVLSVLGALYITLSTMLRNVRCSPRAASSRGLGLIFGAVLIACRRKRIRCSSNASRMQQQPPVSGHCSCCRA